jgi:putative endonuclease
MYYSELEECYKIQQGTITRICSFSCDIYWFMYKILYLYILDCSDGSYYVGVTNDLELRIYQHNTDNKPTSYTYFRRPVKLAYHTYFTDFNLAFTWETKIKKWSHAKKKALVEGNFDLLKLLAKKKFKK